MTKKWTDVKGKKLPELQGEKLPYRYIKLNKSTIYKYYDTWYRVPLTKKPQLREDEYILDGDKLTK